MIGWKVTARTLLVLSLVLLPGILAINPLYGVNFTSLTITLLPSSIVAGSSFSISAILSGATATASGIVIYEVFAGGSCSGATSQFSMVTVANHIVPPPTTPFTMSSPGTFGVNAIYFSTDPNDYGSTSLCKQIVVTKAATTTLTTSFTVTGLSVTDTATFSPAAPTATGTVQYTLYFGNSCSGTYAQASQVSVTSGTIPSSTPFPLTPGVYSLRASYSGDSAHAASTSPCETPVTVQATSSISTALSITTINVGKSVTDVATLGGVATGAAGSITFTLYTGSTCSGTSVNTFTTSVINGVEKSAYTTPIFHAGGPYSIQAVYSGDSIDKGSTSSCELLSVMASPTITTTLQFTTITLAGSVFDKATLTSASTGAGGTVTYQLFPAGTILPGYSSGCAGLPVATDTEPVTAGVVTNSNPFTGATDFPTPGTYFFNAVYSGDPFDNGATSGCELLTVTKASPTITTTLSASTIDFGIPVTDSAALHSASPTAGGTVFYNLYTNSGCSGTVSKSDTETVTNGIVPPPLASFLTPIAAGSYGITAAYSGDPNNNPATSLGCEALTVVPPVTMTVSYSVTGGGSGFSAPWFNYVSGGVPQHVQLTTTATAYSVDSGSTWTLSQTSGGSPSLLLLGSGSSEQWITTSDTGPASTVTTVFNYQNQYFLTMIAGSADGTVSPASGFYNAGASVIITATPNNSFTFTGWTGTGLGSYTGNINPQTITMNAAITETAFFT